MTSATTDTMYNDVEPFFGLPNSDTAKKSGLFVSLNYPSTDFTKAINSEGNVNSIKRTSLWQLMLAKNYKTKANLGDNVISNNFLWFVANVGKHHTKLEGLNQAPAALLPLPVVATTERNNFNTNVYQRFSSLDSEAQMFLSQHVNVVPNVGHMGTVNGIELGALPAKDINTHRFNLKKHDPKATDPNVRRNRTLFCDSLPLLPKGCVDENGNPLNSDALRNIYMGVEGFSQRYAQAGGAALEDSWADGPDGLDVPKFIEACRKCATARMEEEVSVNTPLDVFDAATGQIYRRDKDGKLERKQDDGTYAPVRDDEVREGNNCYSTQISRCDEIYNCLLSGDKRALRRCLRKYANEQDLFDVAKTELKNVHPDVVQKLLNTFHVEPNEHYMEWLGNVRQRLVSALGESDGEEVHQAMLNNRALLNYIHGLIDVANANPTIRGDDRVLSDMEGKKLEKSSSLKYFYRPKASSADAMRPVELDYLLNNLRTLPSNLAGQYQAAIGTIGVIPGMHFPMGLLRGFSGGSKSRKDLFGGSASGLRTLYQNALQALNSKGKDLVDDDKKSIEEAFKQLEVNNEKIVRTIRDLQAFVRLNNAVDVGLTKVSGKDISGLGERNISQLRSSVSSLQSCLGRVTRDQVGLMTSIVDQVLRPMALLAIGAPTGHIVPIGSR
jgi:hypothetical protein